MIPPGACKNSGSGAEPVTYAAVDTPPFQLGAGPFVGCKGRKAIIVVSIKQMSPGHAKRVGLITSAASDEVLRFVIVVDEDIDPTNIRDVLWAVGTRCDPATAMDVISGCFSKATDPLVSPEKRARGDFTTSQAVIYACKPYQWRSDFPVPTRCSPELEQRVKNKFPFLI